MECTKARIRFKVEHPFRVIKRQSGHVKMHYHGAVQEHRASVCVVCLGQPVDDAQEVIAMLSMAGAQVGAK